MQLQLEPIYTIHGKLHNADFYNAMILWANCSFWQIQVPLGILFFNQWLEASKN